MKTLTALLVMSLVLAGTAYADSTGWEPLGKGEAIASPDAARRITVVTNSGYVLANVRDDSDETYNRNGRYRVHVILTPTSYKVRGLGPGRVWANVYMQTAQ